MTLYNAVLRYRSNFIYSLFFSEFLGEYSKTGDDYYQLRPKKFTIHITTLSQ
jgi:hypothetical protein